MSSLSTDDGIFAYRTADGEKRYGIRLRIQGRLWQRQGFTTKTAAQRVRDKIRVERFEGMFFADKYQRQRVAGLTIADLCQYVEDDYRRHHRKSAHSAKGLAEFWRTEAGRQRADALTTKWLTMRADRWLATGITPATVNRRISCLLRGARLANQQGASVVIPYWSQLKESAPRAGFLDWRTFQTIRAALPYYARIPVTIGFWTGMRWGEITSLTTSQVAFDHQHKRVKLSLAAVDTKTKRPRMVIMPGDLYETLRDWLSGAQISPWLCHRHGMRIKTLDSIWKSTCAKLGLARRPPTVRQYTGPLLHDLRRSGVRNLVQAGVPEKVAMMISGHKTRSVFDRYHIVIEADLAEAGEKVVRYCLSESMSESMSAQQDPQTATT